MKTNTKAIIIVIALAVVALVLYAVQVGKRADKNTLVIERGYMIKTSTALGEVWSLEYDSSGKVDQIGLIFDSVSLCVEEGKEIKTCNPSEYSDGQGVQVEGFVDGDQYYVTSMQILDEVKPEEEEVVPTDKEQGQL